MIIKSFFLLRNMYQWHFVWVTLYLLCFTFYIWLLRFKDLYSTNPFFFIMAENSKYQSNLRSNMNQTSRKMTNVYMNKHFFYLFTLRSNTTTLSEFTGTIYILPLTSPNDVVNGINGTDSCDAIYRSV